jgi:hypothetical protein
MRKRCEITGFPRPGANRPLMTPVKVILAVVGLVAVLIIGLVVLVDRFILMPVH